jgi:hypothetical protein
MSELVTEEHKFNQSSRRGILTYLNGYVYSLIAKGLVMTSRCVL